MGGLREGDRVLIHAAAGGVGIAATQIARNVGAEIFGTASPAKHEAIRAQGVDHPIDYRNQDFEAEVMRITGGEGVDLVDRRARPDLASARTTGCCARAGGWSCSGSRRRRTEGGRNIPATLESLAKMPLATMPWWKSLTMMNENKGVFGLNMLNWWDGEGSLDRVIEPLMADLEAGRLEPVVAEAFPFERAGDAHNSSPSAATSARSCCFLARSTSGAAHRAMKKATLILLALLALAQAVPLAHAEAHLHGARSPAATRPNDDPDLAQRRTARSYVIDSDRAARSRRRRSATTRRTTRTS